MLNVALFGPPGAGKGTQSKLLLEKFNLVYISTGDILRAEIKEGTPLGQKAKTIIEKGGLVDDELIVQIIERKIRLHADAKGFLFDGFPRTLVQAYILEGLLLKLNTSLSCMVSLEVPKEELMTRLLHRAIVEGRKDDTEEIINVRLLEYENKTVPVMNFYKEKNLFHPINGVGELSDIYHRLTDAIERSQEKVWRNFVLFGPPGAGKGTQGKMLAKKYNMYYISTGAILRNELARNTDIGKIAAPYMEKGTIVPDDLTIKLIEQKINDNHNFSGFIFKGFPRTIVQAYILDGLLRKLDSSVTSVIDITLPTLESIKRLSARGKTSAARSYDHSADLIVARLEEFNDKTLPVAEYYKKINKYSMVDGRGNQQEVFERLCGAMDNAMKHVW